MEHGHVPYAVLLIIILNQWKLKVKRNSYILIVLKNNGEVPKNFKEKSEFRDFIKTFSRNFATEENFTEATKNYYKAFKSKSEKTESIGRIFESEFCINVNENSDNFWILVRTLKEFYKFEGNLPLMY